jgi:hypothetical protein
VSRLFGLERLATASVDMGAQWFRYVKSEGATSNAQFRKCGFANVFWIGERRQLAGNTVCATNCS